jgi:hypothetical protein
MKIGHRGFKITGMIGDMSAEINDAGPYTEIVLIGVGSKRSFDSDGLNHFIRELEQIRQLVQQVDRANAQNREADK